VVSRDLCGNGVGIFFHGGFKVEVVSRKKLEVKGEREGGTPGLILSTGRGPKSVEWQMNCGFVLEVGTAIAWI